MVVMTDLPFDSSRYMRNWVKMIKTREKNNETTFVMNNWVVLLRSVCGQAEGFSEIVIHDSFIVNTNHFLHYNNEWWCKVNDADFFVEIQDPTLTERYSIHLKDIAEYKVLDISNYTFERIQ